MLPELCGIEFDWFAADSEGNLALFATAGEGFYPESVAKHHIEHEAISESLAAPSTGTFEVWNDYAVLGLYVFDWRLPGGPYERQASPTRTISPELKAKIMAVSGLPTFVGSFTSLRRVEG